MERAITGFHRDEAGDWVAELSCGHDQHVRHRPPFQLRPWVLDDAERHARRGSPLDCPLCDRAELPAALRLVRTSPEWTESSLPAALQRRHRLAPGTWGRLAVRAGRVRFVAEGSPGLDVELVGAGAVQAVAPEVPHEIHPLGAVRVAIEFFAVERATAQAGAPGAAEGGDEGGDPACWAGVLCPECGAVLDGSAHRPGCPTASPG